MTLPALEHSRPEDNRLGLNERLALISLIDEGMRKGVKDSPLVADLFTGLSQLLGATVSGAAIDRLESDTDNKGFKTLEVNAETGDNLGRLNMLYLKKPLPCYYLVYVEVASPYRKKGLGNRILLEFRNFLEEKSAVGILDNIIPVDDPTYDIYVKLAWKTVQEVTGSVTNGDGVYMIYVPEAFKGRDLKDQVLKLVHHIKRKRAAIDMRDNELMVKRTIEEFKDLYSALGAYFADPAKAGDNDALMRYMFTRFVTKLLGFKRRISTLLGYTGGESLGQIVLNEQVRNLTIQSYPPKILGGSSVFVSGDKELLIHLSEALKQNPAREIEALPNYQRPNLIAWLKANNRSAHDPLTIGDLLELEFDPSRLKEITINGEDHIFERMQAGMLAGLELRKTVLERFANDPDSRLGNTALKMNPPLLVIRDRGNLYVLRRKIHGIHVEEALEQLQTADDLKQLNKSMSVDRLVKNAVKRSKAWMQSRLNQDELELMDQVSFFVGWDIESNRPKLVVDFSGNFIETVWIA
jgi:hypothetical protein